MSGLVRSFKYSLTTTWGTYVAPTFGVGSSFSSAIDWLSNFSPLKLFSELTFDSFWGIVSSVFKLVIGALAIYVAITSVAKGNYILAAVAAAVLATEVYLVRGEVCVIDLADKYGKEFNKMLHYQQEAYSIHGIWNITSAYSLADDYNCEYSTDKVIACHWHNRSPVKPCCTTQCREYKKHGYDVGVTQKAYLAKICNCNNAWRTDPTKYHPRACRYNVTHNVVQDVSSEPMETIGCKSGKPYDAYHNGSLSHKLDSCIMLIVLLLRSCERRVKGIRWFISLNPNTIEDTADVIVLTMFALLFSVCNISDFVIIVILYHLGSSLEVVCYKAWEMYKRGKAFIVSSRKGSIANFLTRFPDFQGENNVVKSCLFL